MCYVRVGTVYCPSVAADPSFFTLAVRVQFVDEGPRMRVWRSSSVHIGQYKLKYPVSFQDVSVCSVSDWIRTIDRGCTRNHGALSLPDRFQTCSLGWRVRNMTEGPKAMIRLVQETKILPICQSRLLLVDQMGLHLWLSADKDR